ncbi:MAG: Dipeptide transport system permease protein DppC (TC 3.A.1.5.2) [uncultured Thiotrichaceae bacterium]|uniref:Dipeptide transport system permease protein DppC (TC 3.A.1.5.2) n=1 Tax=uncultured Thiotrichaceae bacterium TaxID=298394 RepID=A0A6S6STU9_9GAMM|nr:MAG: Dipeptide transport system permease protein DppC (TC 3.A.1.5.2) [uncultured Thiotrichaceae bacterium]
MNSTEHWVSDKPFNPDQATELTPEQEKVYFASQWRLMWWKFKKHKLAMASGIFLLAMYTMILFVEFISPYELQTRHTQYIYSPPQSVHLFDESGKFRGPFVYGWKQTMDMDTLMRTYTEDKSKIYPVKFFHRGEDYELMGLVSGNLHLFGVEGAGKIFLLGTDRLGRDMFSRIVHGARISLTIGLLGITVSFTLGLLLGGMAGYYGGWIDNLVQRMTEIIRSFPELPLWMALSALLPVNWSPLWIFFGITVILAMLDWTGLARAVRSKLMSLREEDYASAAVLMGAKPKRIIVRHLLPGFFSHLIASATLSIPAMILGETALSFLGLGLRPPITSWGVLLNEAQNINIVAIYPWLILPVVPVILVILAFNFLGDGLRDAADPYKH